MTKAETLLMIIKEELEKHNACSNINIFVSVAALETLFAGIKPALKYSSIKRDWKEMALNILPDLMEEETWNDVNNLICNKFHGNYNLEDFAKATRIAAAKLNNEDAEIKHAVMKDLCVIEKRERITLE